MTLVTVAEARENLPELLRRAAAGEQIVITEGGQWLAALGKAPVPVEASVPPPGVESAVVARREQLIREWQGLSTDAPVPKPEEMSHEEYVARYRKAG